MFRVELNSEGSVMASAIELFSLFIPSLWMIFEALLFIQIML